MLIPDKYNASLYIPLVIVECLIPGPHTTANLLDLCHALQECSILCVCRKTCSRCFKWLRVHAEERFRAIQYTVGGVMKACERLAIKSSRALSLPSHLYIFRLNSSPVGPAWPGSGVSFSGLILCANRVPKR